MRGKVRMHEGKLAMDRITPAYAGKSSVPCHRRNFLEDHPRLCGEKGTFGVDTSTTTGSPPPMRGKVAPSTPKRKTMRITPAYAGKSRYFSGGRRDRRDHPRLCGEKSDLFLNVRKPVGSPPPMRGKVGGEGEGKDRVRITPAYAGKSQ